MGTTFKHAPKLWSGEISDGSSVDDGRPGHAVAAEDIFDDPSILRELDEANASLADTRDAEPRRLVPARLPPVDAFDFDGACRGDDFDEAEGPNDFDEADRAKSLAHRLGPPGDDRSPKRSWWNLTAARNLREYPAGAEWRNRPAHRQAPRGRRRALLWGLCTSVAIVIAAPVIFGNFRHLSEPPPAPVGDVRNNDDAKASLVAQGARDNLAAVNEAAAGDQSNETVVVRRPVAAAIMAPATTAFAAPLVRPASTTDDSDVANSPADVSQVAPGPDASVTGPSPVDDGAPQSASSSSETTTPAHSADRDFTLMAQSQLSVNADPVQTEALDSTAAKTITPAEADGSPLSGDQIDRLLARGEDLLRSGDIASARLLFLRVAAAGDRRGAKAVGMTYDPKIYAHLPVMGLEPDLAQAELWYEKAGENLSYTIDLTSPAASAQAPEPAEDEALRQWNAACASKYLSFEPSTGLYTARSGTKRRCQLP